MSPIGLKTPPFHIIYCVRCPKCQKKIVALQAETRNEPFQTIICVYKDIERIELSRTSQPGKELNAPLMAG